MRALLHVGCGGEQLPGWLQGYSETRLDASSECNPDIVAPMTSMGDIGPFDALYCSHALEHLPPGLVGVALSEFLRVLRTGGQAIITVPDLEDVRPTRDIIMQSPAGPLCGLDLIYGWHGATAQNPLMRHCSGFVAETLQECMEEAGFAAVGVVRGNNYELIGVGRK